MLLPSWQTGYASGPAESEYPELWRGLVCAGAPQIQSTSNGPNTLYDLSGNNLHGAIQGSPVWEDSDIGTVLRVSGATADYILLPNIASFFGVEATFFFRLRLDNNAPSSVDNTGFTFLSTNFSTDHYPYTNGNVYATAFRNDQLLVENNSAFDKTRWHTVTITQQAGSTGWKFYQNNRLVISTDGEPQAFMTTTPWIARSQGGAARHLYGRIAEYRLYNRAWSGYEVYLNNSVPYAPFVPRRHIYGFTVGAPETTFPPNSLALTGAGI